MAQMGVLAQRSHDFQSGFEHGERQPASLQRYPELGQLQLVRQPVSSAEHLDDSYEMVSCLLLLLAIWPVSQQLPKILWATRFPCHEQFSNQEKQKRGHGMQEGKTDAVARVQGGGCLMSHDLGGRGWPTCGPTLDPPEQC